MNDWWNYSFDLWFNKFCAKTETTIDLFGEKHSTHCLFTRIFCVMSEHKSHKKWRKRSKQTSRSSIDGWLCVVRGLNGRMAANVGVVVGRARGRAGGRAGRPIADPLVLSVASDHIVIVSFAVVWVSVRQMGSDVVSRPIQSCYRFHSFDANLSF